MGVCLCQFRIYVTSKELLREVHAKCRPTVHKQPPFYKLFVTIARSVQLDGPQIMVEGANCYCAAGETQSWVHVKALLFTLAEVSAAACTSLPCDLVCKNSSCSCGKSLSNVARLVSHSSLAWSSTEVSQNMKGSSGHSRWERGVVAVAAWTTSIVCLVSTQDGPWSHL